MNRQTLITAICASAATACLIISIQYYKKARTIKNSNPDSESDLVLEPLHLVSKEQEQDMKEALMKEQLARNIAFLGKDGVDRVQNSFVIIVGLGGVGSHAANMLLRSGVGKLRLIDFDQVTLSSLNRHAVANRAHVGIPKVTAMKQNLLEISPDATIEDIVDIFTAESAERLLDGKPDFVLDCIDNIKTKAELINYCCSRGLRIVSSMGAGAKADPSRIQIADISSTYEDHLARATRRELKKLGFAGNCPVVYSTEKPGEIKLLPLEDSKVPEADQYANLPTFRSRILPVLGTIPALFGNAMASFTLTEIARFSTEPLVSKSDVKQIQRFYMELVQSEQKLHGSNAVVRLTAEDLGFIFEDVIFNDM
jgi:tRNA A37 threonylcarbamoyladenosine dehydratase